MKSWIFKDIFLKYSSLSRLTKLTEVYTTLCYEERSEFVIPAVYVRARYGASHRLLRQALLVLLYLFLATGRDCLASCSNVDNR